MIDYVAIGVLVLTAGIGIFLYIRHEQQNACTKDGGSCPDCPLRNQCTKPQKQ